MSTGVTALVSCRGTSPTSAGSPALGINVHVWPPIQIVVMSFVRKLFSNLPKLLLNKKTKTIWNNKAISVKTIINNNIFIISYEKTLSSFPKIIIHTDTKKLPL